MYFPLIRQPRWKVKLLWQYVFTMFHNTRIFRNLSACNYSSLEWRKHYAFYFLIKTNMKKSIYLKSLIWWITDNRFTDSVNKRAQCLFCSRKTYQKCTACSIEICDKCFYSSKHLNYVGTDKFKHKRKPINWNWKIIHLCMCIGDLAIVRDISAILQTHVTE